jgi:hypothetical protein
MINGADIGAITAVARTKATPARHDGYLESILIPIGERRIVEYVAALDGISIGTEPCMKRKVRRVLPVGARHPGTPIAERGV